MYGAIICCKLYCKIFFSFPCTACTGSSLNSCTVFDKNVRTWSQRGLDRDDCPDLSYMCGGQGGPGISHAQKSHAEFGISLEHLDIHVPRLCLSFTHQPLSPRKFALIVNALVLRHSRYWSKFCPRYSYHCVVFTVLVFFPQCLSVKTTLTVRAMQIYPQMFGTPTAMPQTR